ncbi:MAG: sugar phosphate nucleotidyltransferase [Myxococcota bacterium]
MYDAFVLAAGLGTRLRPLTEHRPKPLVPMCGVPLLAYSLVAAGRHGLRDVIINAHWLSEQIEAWAGPREGVSVTVSTELPEVLGTGGGLKRAAEQMAPTFVVLNADVLHDVDLTRLRAAVPAGGAAMALRSDPENAPRYGVVAADAEQVVTRLVKVASATPAGAEDTSTHFTGIHALSREALALVPDGVSDIVRTAYKALVPQRRVRAIRYDGVWLDAGDPAAYLDANLQLLQRRFVPALDPFTRAGWARTPGGEVTGDPALVHGATVRGPAWVGAGAELSGVTLDTSIVGAGARVARGATLTRSVVWDGATVPAGDWSDVVVHPGGVLATR